MQGLRRAGTCSGALRCSAVPTLPAHRGCVISVHQPRTITSSRTIACRAFTVDKNSDCGNEGQQQQQEEQQHLTAPPKKILERRSVVYETAMHKPLGLVLFGAYVLGSASSLAGRVGRHPVATFTTLAHHIATSSRLLNGLCAAPVRLLQSNKILLQGAA